MPPPHSIVNMPPPHTDWSQALGQSGGVIFMIRILTFKVKVLKKLWEKMDLTALPFFGSRSAQLFGGW